MKSILDELRTRGILDGITNEAKFLSLREDQRGIYGGFDPTANSLHLGNYLLISVLKRFKKCGFNVLAVIGGATGRIGDPSFKKEARNFIKGDVITNNIKSLKKQLESFGLETFDNYKIYEKLNPVEFLKNAGTLINVSSMLTKDSVAARLKSGLNFAEFSYQLMQGYDFLYLYKNRNITIQIGGSDQWGNITTGLTMINKADKQATPIGLTTKLILDSNEQKFGKSQEGAIWIQKSLSNAYKCYQYLLNQDDEKAENLLLWLTFLPLAETKKIILAHKKNSKKKLIQKELARLICEDIYGEKLTKKAKLITSILFEENSQNLKKEDLVALKDSLKTVTLGNGNLLDILVDNKLIKSRREAKELIKQGALWIDFKKVDSISNTLDLSVYGDFSLIRLGKRKYYLVTK